MAKGLPDYYRGVDIILQSIAEITNRPKYGSGQNAAGYHVVTANAQTILAQITGKGMIYGGYVRIEYTSTQAGGGVFLYVDDEKLGSIGFDALRKWGMTVEHSYPVYLRTFDDVNFIYTVAFSHGFTFEESLRLDYIETDGTTPTAWWQIIYALV